MKTICIKRVSHGDTPCKKRKKNATSDGRTSCTGWRAIWWQDISPKIADMEKLAQYWLEVTRHKIKKHKD